MLTEVFLQVPSCVRSGLFKAFTEHTLHRLGITQDNHSVSPMAIGIWPRIKIHVI